MGVQPGLIVPLYLALFAVVSYHAQSFQPQDRKVAPNGGIIFHKKFVDGKTSAPLQSSSSLPASAVPDETTISDNPWYSHSDIGRDRSHVQKHYNKLSDIFKRYPEEQQDELCADDRKDGNENLAVDISNGSKFLLVSPNGMWFLKSSSCRALPLYLTASQLEDVFSCAKLSEVSSNNFDDENNVHLLAWVGKYDNQDYWVIYLKANETGDHAKVLSRLTEVFSNESRESSSMLDCKPLREFGDSLEFSHDAGILATANGLVEFHKIHLFCSLCGGATEPTKAGGSRTCTVVSCRRSVYPRIDSAAIMLITSPCENYAVLGRKRSWPPGRYSTLAGFCEVGETLEECCVRETFEESGAVVDPKSLKFVASQPWPFPRSLMVGFRGKVMASSNLPVESGTASISLPEIVVDTDEMEDIRWFAKDFVKKRLSLSGSTALSFEPNEMEKEFHIPGKASLARYIITEWANEIR
ncbi:unnamed protein product [Pseudo-nitzschia multistriata]|uniref:NAD(+) diphosphatase n=1 Tax=Pseudo-nitzschia multistriata TaxID=183589 RepID=A0A448ZMQ5_9STRA|nr:unnamed protein product [Pseudo-nitzschia multistriata]